MNDNIPFKDYDYDDIMIRVRFTKDYNNMLIDVVKPPSQYAVRSAEVTADRFFIEKALEFIQLVRGD